jgi:dTDP-4-amino-4,6-dideoxy-D-galactose acyltransferase
VSASTRGATVGSRCELLDWDSRFFGLTIARLRADRLGEEEADAVLEWCERHAVNCLYFLANGDDRETLRAVEARSFDLVDVRIDLSCRLDAATRDPLAEGVRLANASDRAALAAISREAFTASRFFFDGRFPHERCAALFETWIDRALAGELAEAVLCIDLDGAPAGFVTCELDESGDGRIGLLGVSAPARGRGAGTRLCRTALEWFAREGAGRATVTTQGRSVPALRLYESCGFSSSAVALWYHRWFERQAA